MTLTDTKPPASKTESAANRRRQPRFASRLGVRYQGGTEEQRYACTINVGPGGLLLWTNSRLEQGEMIEGKVRLPGGEVVSFVGQVRWTSLVSSDESALLQAGIQFSVMPEAPFYEMLVTRAVQEQKSRALMGSES